MPGVELNERSSVEPAQGGGLAHIAEPLRPLAVPVDSLTLDPANARKHPEKNLEAIKASLRRFGQRAPLVVQREGMVVRAGNGRLMAAKALGWQYVAAIVVDESAIDATAFAIADNRTSDLAEWDDGTLARLLESLPSDLKEAAGYDDKDMKELLASLGGDVVEDEAPEPLPEPVSRRGDLWVLGGHRILCGDSTDGGDVALVMNGERASIFQTDPPYVVNYKGGSHPKSKTNVREDGTVREIDWSSTYKEQDIDGDGSEFYDAFIKVAVEVAIQPNAAWYCWHASRRQAMLEAVWVKHGAFVHQQIIWHKTRPVLTYSMYMWAHEPCLMGWMVGQKPSVKKSYSKGEWPRSVWEIPTAEVESDEHPTSKPVRIFGIPLEMHTVDGDLCYEPFSGSGSQIIAAEQLGRRCFAIEIEPRYVDVAVRRWQKLTGKSATHADTGKTWEETAAERGVKIE